MNEGVRISLGLLLQLNKRCTEEGGTDLTHPELILANSVFNVS